MMIENLIIDGPVQAMFSESKTLSDVRYLLSSIMKLLEEIFCLQAKLCKEDFAIPYLTLG